MTINEVRQEIGEEVFIDENADKSIIKQ